MRQIRRGPVCPKLRQSGVSGGEQLCGSEEQWFPQTMVGFGKENKQVESNNSSQLPTYAGNMPMLFMDLFISLWPNAIRNPLPASYRRPNDPRNIQ